MRGGSFIWTTNAFSKWQPWHTQACAVGSYFVPTSLGCRSDRIVIDKPLDDETVFIHAKHLDYVKEVSSRMVTVLTAAALLSLMGSSWVTVRLKHDLRLTASGPLACPPRMNPLVHLHLRRKSRSTSRPLPTRRLLSGSLLERAEVGPKPSHFSPPRT